jgi:ribosomal protein S18 acetylase RimI-like enzyme
MTPDYAITVRPATPHDAAATAALSRRVFTDTFVDEFKIAYDPMELLAFLDKSHGEASILAKIADPAAEVWLAEANGELVGYASAGPMSLPHPNAKPGDRELYRLYVSAAFHGVGVAAALMEAIIDGVQWLGVWSENFRAQRFYARYGFEKAGEYDYPVGRTIDREFILRRVRFVALNRLEPKP